MVVTDSDPAWIDVTTDLKFFDSADQFVWTSEKSGYRHAYLYNYGGDERQLTNGDWEIGALIGLGAGAWKLTAGPVRWVLAVVIPLVAATAWGVYLPMTVMALVPPIIKRKIPIKAAEAIIWDDVMAVAMA